MRRCCAASSRQGGRRQLPVRPLTRGQRRLETLMGPAAQCWAEAMGKSQGSRARCLQLCTACLSAEGSYACRGSDGQWQARQLTSRKAGSHVASGHGAESLENLQWRCTAWGANTSSPVAMMDCGTYCGTCCKPCTLLTNSHLRPTEHVPRQSGPGFLCDNANGDYRMVGQVTTTQRHTAQHRESHASGNQASAKFCKNFLKPSAGIQQHKLVMKALLTASVGQVSSFAVST